MYRNKFGSIKICWKFTINASLHQQILFNIDFSDAFSSNYEQINFIDDADAQDLLRGYECQNQFLNKEILELHNVVQCLESREQLMARRNFDLEAEFYQLKSRYLLLLNHFKPNKGVLCSFVIWKSM